MSLSNPTRSNNPATKFIKFAGDRGEWFYFDKEKEENVKLKLPAYFIILDELSTITGYDESSNSFIYSNEIHNSNEILTVKSFKGNLNIVGTYQDIKYEVKAKGGRYCKSVYCMHIGDGNNELVNIKFSGSSLSPFIEAKINQSKQIMALMPNMEKGHKGKTEYYIPSIDPFKMKDNLLPLAIELDKELQEYLTQYKSKSKHEKVEQEETLDYTDTQVKPDPLDVDLDELEQELQSEDDPEIPF